MSNPELRELFSISDNSFLALMDSFVREQQLLIYQEIYVNEYNRWLEYNRCKRKCIEQNLLNNYKLN